MRNVAVTGISGYVGTLMLRQLDREKEVQTVVGVDIKPPSYSSGKDIVNLMWARTVD